MLGHFKHEGIGLRWSVEADEQAAEETWVVRTYVGAFEVTERCPIRPNLTRAVEVAKGLAPVLLDRVRDNAA